MREYREIKVRWDNQRQINRIYKWLKLDPDWSGMLFRNKQIVGYKLSKGGFLSFIFWIENT